MKTDRMNTRLNWPWALALMAALALAGWVRFADLSRAATRADELNLMRYAKDGMSVVELWRHPPFVNQIPLADSLPVLWAKAQPRRTVDERLVREPFAWLGLFTVGIAAGWAWKKGNGWAALLAAVWLGLAPFHVFHARSAYYYGLMMFFATGMILHTVDLAQGLFVGVPPKIRAWTVWFLLVLGTCLSHMSAWAVAGMMACLLAWAGWTGLSGQRRKAFFAWWSGAGALLLLAMSRWIFRAVHETMLEAANSARDPELTHVGFSLNWIASRTLPVFVGGANWIGWTLVGAMLASGAFVWWRARNVAAGKGDALGVLGWAVWLGLAAALAYVGLVGGGKGKWVYFSAPAPALIVWAALVLDRFWSLWGEKTRKWGMAGCVLAVAGALLYPAAQVVRLDGKPTAYRQIQRWLDENLSPGDVAIVDRWFEPWCEMGFYPTTNVFVSFTVPDEPYQNYAKGNWRQVTKDLFERNGAQAFIRIQRNHEKRIGLWTWPEIWFKRRAVVAGKAGLWLRDTGFAPMEEYYSETNRVETEIFYDTHDDIAARAQTAGKDAAWFFGAGWPLFKPWQQGDFSDYRVLERGAAMEIRNLRGIPLRMKGEVVAVGMGGSQTVKIGDHAPLAFPAGQLTAKTFEFDLPAGRHSLEWKNLSRGGALLVRDFRLERAE